MECIGVHGQAVWNSLLVRSGQYIHHEADMRVFMNAFTSSLVQSACFQRQHGSASSPLPRWRHAVVRLAHCCPIQGMGQMTCQLQEQSWVQLLAWLWALVLVQARVQPDVLEGGNVRFVLHDDTKH